ncbi:MAG TPA: hypothetical protein VMU69_31065 [Bradyrhizobium sp.]|nr:hypothetical protein [Bradyrhizobium sp.]
MIPEDKKRIYRRDLLIASVMTVAGFAISGVSLAEIIISDNAHVAQATPPLQGTPAPLNEDKKPAPSKPGGERPTTPAPQPARPDPQAQKEGATPALPPAPAEKTAPPIEPKK